MDRKDSRLFDSLTRREIFTLAAGTALLGLPAACVRKEARDMEKAKAEEEVWQTVQALNRAWTEEGDAGKLRDYFHRDMVAIVPGSRERLEGRDACVASWKAFTGAATIHYFNVTGQKVQLYGDNRFAVATYYYDMSFDIGGETVKTGGRDMFVLVRQDGRWWAVADQFSPYPEERQD